jgi:virginiamycin B lyase
VTVAIRIKIPKRKHHRHDHRPAYVSASTQGMTLLLGGATALSETIGLTPGSPGCTAGAGGTICTESVALAPCPSPANCYSGVIVTYDKVLCLGSACTIPPEAHQLSANQDISFSVVTGKQNTVPLTLDGIPASVAILPGPFSTLVGNSASGFALSKCVTAPQVVSVVGVDADGNDIVGPGAPASPTLTSNDTTHLAVATPPPSSPNTFELVPPSSLVSTDIPNPGSVVHLTAGVTPLSDSGASTQSSPITVTFNSDVCGVITEYSIPSASNSFGIVAGPDGAIWFTEPIGNSIGRIETSGSVTETAIPTPASDPLWITVGPDRALWFTEFGAASIGRITTRGTIVTTTTPTSSSQPRGIVAGPDGAVWFSEYHANKIGRVTTTPIAITETSVPTPFGDPFGITAGPDGALWFAERDSNKIGRITTNGAITETMIPTVAGGPSEITTGPDHALWFTESGSNKVGRITTAATITEDAVPTNASFPFGIAAGPDGALWFTELDGNKVGRITTGGSITELTVSTVNARPTDIAVGPDGALWFTEENGSKIGRIQ